MANFFTMRLESLKQLLKYGPTRVKLAQQVSQGRDLADIIATGTPEEKEIASLAAQKKDPLWQDAYDAVFAAKYSPGRQIANTFLPEGLEGSGILYKGISGIGDAAYRLFVFQPLLLVKPKKHTMLLTIPSSKLLVLPRR
jgi:hypothetical protein